MTRDGVLDMLGNVTEKTSTGFTPNPKSSRLQHGSNWANDPESSSMGLVPAASAVRATCSVGRDAGARV